MFGRNPKTLKVGQFILRRDSKAKSINCPKGKFVPKHPVIKKANGLFARLRYSIALLPPSLTK